MPSPQQVPTAQSTRILHAAMLSGVVMFGLVAHFVLRRTFADAPPFPAFATPLLLGLTLGACALSLVLRKRVPQRSSTDSADLFWARATQPALLTWAPLEGASLLSIFVYARTGSQAAIIVAAVAVLLFVVLNPSYLERR